MGRTTAAPPLAWSRVFPGTRAQVGEACRLLIVSQLARGWGRTGDAAAGWTVWFEIDCPESED